MTTSRTALTALAVAAATLGAASPALAGTGQHSTNRETLTSGDRVPAAIHGSQPKALYAAGDRVRPHEAVLQSHVGTPAHKGLAVRLTCPKGFVVGYGFKGADALAINGHPITGRHSLVVSVQSAQDTDHNGRLGGTLLALCEGA